MKVKVSICNYKKFGIEIDVLALIVPEKILILMAGHCEKSIF